MSGQPATAWVARLRREIAELTDPDARSRAARAAFLAALDRLPAPLDPAADPTHVTASAVVVGPRGILLHRHLRLGIWLQPGGHVEPAEAPWDAAVREVGEETGLAAAHPGPAPHLLHVDVHPAPRGHVHLDLRYLLHADGDPAPPPSESQQVAWFPPAQALALADDALVGALHALEALRGSRTPPSGPGAGGR